MYAVCAFVFIGLSGLLLHSLIIGPGGRGSLKRFYALFGVAFTVYAVAWIAAWMLLRGHTGGVVGLFAGTTAMGCVLAHAFAARGMIAIIKIIVALFVLNALGYFGGGWIEGSVSHLNALSFLGTARMTLAQLLWGVFYGIGFGAGLGYAFHTCQARIRDLLRI